MDFFAIISDARVVTAVVGILISYFLNCKFENLKRSIDIKGKLFDKKMEAHPKMIEQIYRFRNLSRDFLLQINDEVDIDEIKKTSSKMDSTIEALVTNLYEYRLYLEKDDFKTVHSFKDLVVDYKKKLIIIQSIIIKNTLKNATL